MITSWGGTSMAIVRRLTFTILSTNGISRTRPGPLAAISRPSRNMTARSYSRRILTAVDRNTTTMMSTGTI